VFSVSYSTENGEKEVPEPPPEPPKKTPPPPPPKKEEAGGAGLEEFWGELEVQRVKFLVRTQQGRT
jgi:ryanodine receptor 1